MKKIVVLLLAAMMTLSLIACGGGNTDTDNDANVNTEANTDADANQDVEADQDAEADQDVEADATATVPTFSCDWDKVVFTFNEDGTFKMELPEYQITEEGTWAIADGAITVTSPAGKTYTSTIEDGVCKLNYTADASEQLVAQLYTSDYAFLNTEASEGTETTSSVPAFVCDWDKVVFTFNEDGTCKMELAEYQITEEATWVQNEDGTYTVTSPAGKEYVSYVGEDGLVHLDYTADVNAQLVAQLYIK